MTLFRIARTVAAVVSVAFVSVALSAPTYALTDTNLNATTANVQTATVHTTDTAPTLSNQPIADTDTAMPDNPTQELPETVDAAIPDDATVVSEELAVTEDGEVQNLETGETVTDPELVGSADTQPDPLAKTDGESFIPVDVSEVRDALGEDNGSSADTPAEDAGTAEAQTETDTANNADSATADTDLNAEGAGDATDSEEETDADDVTDSGEETSAQSDQTAQETRGTQGTVRLASLQGNEYGAHWGTYNGTQAFFEADGTLFAQQAKGVVDVSEWQGQIDWQAAKNAGVEGAIIRISYGWNNGFDQQAVRNISECKRLGIPFGIYSYSYSYDSSTAAAEGADIVNLLRRAGVSPSDLSYPVFYDLEQWAWTGHTPPTSPNVYDGIVNAWYSQLQAAGYTNLSVYSYTNYLNTALNSNNIRSKTRWVASYGSRTNFPYSTNDRGWQYTSGGSVAGISGRVDLNAFGTYSVINMLWQYRDDDIAVGAAVASSSSQLEYKWMSYNVDKQEWKTIAEWSGANWAGWSDDKGTYWLHVEVRDGATKGKIGEQTIAFAYIPGTGSITGTYSGWSGQQVLLGMSSDKRNARYEMKIYDVNKGAWVQGFSGQWAYWNPVKGVYWTHYELYTSDGRLADTKTYAFGVS